MLNRCRSTKVNESTSSCRCVNEFATATNPCMPSHNSHVQIASPAAYTSQFVESK